MLSRPYPAVPDAVRTDRWRYAEWDDGSAMLLDPRTDPHESRNLASDPSYRPVVEEMKALLAKLPQ